MKRTLVFGILFSACIIIAAGKAHVLHGATTDELRKKIQDRESEIKKLEQEITVYQKSLETQSGVSKTLNGEVKKLETQIKALNADIRLTELQIDRTESTISELSGEIHEKEARVDANKESIAELLRSIHANDDESLIETLLAHGTISEMLDEAESLDAVNGELQNALETIRAEKRLLEDERTKKELEEANLQSLKKDLSGRKRANESVNQEKKELLRDSKSQEARYQQLVKQREERRTALQQEMKSIEDELRRLIDPSLIPSKGSGVLGWPVASPLVTQQFGYTEFATTYGSDVYKGNGHNGIDLRAPIGTAILAAADGVVRGTGNTDALCPGGSYGKWILIEHSNGLSTLYAHLSSIGVNANQEVKRGDRIGYSGSTGFVTGPHLHFTVYASNTYRLHQTKHCGLIPAGGYLNPIDYL